MISWVARSLIPVAVQEGVTVGAIPSSVLRAVLFVTCWYSSDFGLLAFCGWLGSVFCAVLCGYVRVTWLALWV